MSPDVFGDLMGSLILILAVSLVWLLVVCIQRWTQFGGPTGCCRDEPDGPSEQTPTPGGLGIPVKRAAQRLWSVGTHAKSK